MTKDMQKACDNLNKSLKDNHSLFRFTAVTDCYWRTHKINKLGIQYTDKGKERLVKVSTIQVNLTTEQALLILQGMLVAVNCVKISNVQN